MLLQACSAACCLQFQKQFQKSSGVPELGARWGPSPSWSPQPPLPGCRRTPAPADSAPFDLHIISLSSRVRALPPPPGCQRTPAPANPRARQAVQAQCATKCQRVRHTMRLQGDFGSEVQCRLSRRRSTQHAIRASAECPPHLARANTITPAAAPSASQPRNQTDTRTTQPASKPATHHRLHCPEQRQGQHLPAGHRQQLPQRLPVLLLPARGACAGSARRGRLTLGRTSVPRGPSAT